MTSVDSVKTTPPPCANTWEVALTSSYVPSTMTPPVPPGCGAVVPASKSIPHMGGALHTCSGPQLPPAPLDEPPPPVSATQPDPVLELCVALP